MNNQIVMQKYLDLDSLEDDVKVLNQIFRLFIINDEERSAIKPVLVLKLKEIIPVINSIIQIIESEEN